MARNVALQVLRGTQANLQTLQSSTTPLQSGEMYFATDTGNLFFGVPGFGVGYIQIGDTANVNERLDKLLLINEGIRRALVALACQGGQAKPEEFEPATIAAEASSSTVASVN